MVEIRMIEREEYRAAKRVAARAFSPLHYFFISMSPDTLIAVEDGEILGGIVMKKSRISRAWSVGVIDWVFVHPDQQGRGIGQQLADAGIQLLREKGCEEIYAIVEGYNTSSQKLWSNRGFSVLSPFEQLRRFGLRFLMVWIAAFHLFDIGHDLWGMPVQRRVEHGPRQFWGNLVIQSLIALLALYQVGALRFTAPVNWLMIPVLILIYFGGRQLAMLLTARRMGVPVRYRMWESGYLVSAVVALFGGGFFPVTGGLYPDQDHWTYREALPKLGPMALSGAMTHLVFAAALRTALDVGWIQESFWTQWAVIIGIGFIIFDIIVTFFPFDSYNGRRLWDWNKLIWAMMALGGLLVIFIY